MSTLVVQEHHLWLYLANMRDANKVRFLNAPVSKTGLFGDAVECFALQFSVAQKQTEAIRHILPWRAAAASTRPPPTAPQPARCRGQPPASALTPTLHPQQPSAKQEPLAVSGRASGPETGDPEMERTALREMVNARRWFRWSRLHGIWVSG